MPTKILAVSPSCTGLGLRVFLLREYTNREVIVVAPHGLQRLWYQYARDAECGPLTVVLPRTAVKPEYAERLAAADLVLIDGDNTSMTNRAQLAQIIHGCKGEVVFFAPTSVDNFRKNSPAAVNALIERFGPNEAIDRFATIRERLTRMPNPQMLRAGPANQSK